MDKNTAEQRLRAGEALFIYDCNNRLSFILKYGQGLFQVLEYDPSKKMVSGMTEHEKFDETVFMETWKNRFFWKQEKKDNHEQ